MESELKQGIQLNEQDIEKASQNSSTPPFDIRGYTLWSILVVLMGFWYLFWNVDVNDIKLPKPDENVYGIYNAKILIYKDKPYYKEAAVIANGKFEYIGDHKAVKKLYPKVKKYDLKRHTVLPGLIDAHAHLLGRGRQNLQVDLTGSKSISEIQSKIIVYSKTWKQAPFLEGYGWDQNLFKEQKFPTYKDLVFYSSDYDQLNKIPISLTRVDFHGTWVNKAALDLAIKATPNLLDPKFSVPGGDIIRDSNGHPTGVFIDNARSLVMGLIPEPSEEMEMDALNSITQEMLSFGLTGAHDAGISIKELRVFEKALKEDSLSIRVHSMIMCMEKDTHCSKENFKSLNLPDKNYLNKNRLFVRGIKVVLDGALGSWGAAMIEPYSDKNSTGLITYDLDILRKRMSIWSKMGFQINSHAIGDLANRMALDNYEYLLNNITKKELKKQRHRIEHSQLLTAKDLPRFAELGIIPSMQPTHATSDMLYAEKRIGPERIKYAYAWKSLLKSGVQALPFSSDFPVELVDPRLGLYAAITRLDKNGNSPSGSNGWYKNEAVSPYQALKGFTIDAAFSAFKENEIGSIEVGKLADFIIVKKSWLDIPAKELLHDNSRVRATFLSGKRVF